MVQKLKLVLESQRLRLVLKTAFFGFLLYWATETSASIFSIGLFLVATFVMYFRPIFNNLTYMRSFMFLLGLTLFTPIFFSGLYNILVFAFFVVAFYIILALKEFVLVKRIWWHYSLVISLLYLATFIASLKVNPDNFFSITALLAVSAFVVMSEFTKVSLEIDTPKSLLISAVFSFLIFEGFWVASILPLGVIGSANLVALGIFMFMDLATNFYTNKLDWRLIWRRIILFSVLAAILFSGVKWRL